MNRLDSNSSRFGPDLRDAIEVMPGLGGIALWVKFVDSDESALVARTDGVYVEAGPRYKEFNDSERRFILLHELLHVALAHSARAREVKRRSQDFDERLYNIACDAIINASLDGIRGIRAPEAAVSLEKVLGVIGLWKDGDNSAEAVRRWSSEALYRAMIGSGKQVEIIALDVSLGLKSDDLIPDQEGTGPDGEGHSTEETIRAWSSRLTMARGCLAGIFNRLINELPQVKTPWERILRDLLFRHAQRKRRLDPSRPTRRWLALEGDLKQREGIDLPFERAMRADRTGRIAIAVDTSGSIDERVLNRFIAEIASILERIDPLVRMIIGDMAVHQIYDLTGREGAKLLRNLKFKGGGGTDFRPAIAEAAKWNPDLLIYLTDLEGEAGNEPRLPVLWAVPEGLAKAPWGRLIELN